jgi:hypothetical protein
MRMDSIADESDRAYVPPDEYEKHVGKGLH